MKKKTKRPQAKSKVARRPAGKGASRKGGGGPARKAARKALRAAAPAAAPAENPTAKALAQRIAALTVDKKALEVVILDVRGKTSYADYFVIASGESERQVSAMGEHVATTLKAEQQLSPLGQEGLETGSWVLLDFGDVVAHLFHQEVRAFYDLEGLWADAPREKVA